MRELTHLLEALSPEPINHLGIVVLLKQRNYPRLPLRRQCFDRRNTEMIRVLVRDPHVRNARKILVSQDRLRIQCPALIERLALEPRIAPEAHVTHFTYHTCVPDKCYPHLTPHSFRVSAAT